MSIEPNNQEEYEILEDIAQDGPAALLEVVDAALNHPATAEEFRTKQAEFARRHADTILEELLALAKQNKRMQYKLAALDRLEERALGLAPQSAGAARESSPPITVNIETVNAELQRRRGLPSGE